MRLGKGAFGLAAGAIVFLAACGGSDEPALPSTSTPLRAAGPPEGAASAVTTSLGWDVAPLQREYGLGVPYQLVGFACAKGLPPGATVVVRVAGSAGARPTLGVDVGPDGTVVVPFGLLRPGEVVWEFQSITAKNGAGYGQLPRGATGTITDADQPCPP